jgi:nitrite reductase/ring-hydroxylating ferredoxin subunit
VTVHNIEGFAAPAEGELTKVEVDGQAVAVAIVEGVAYAVDDQCTHMQCSLSQGDVEGTSLVCPCHGGTFDLRTGQVLAGPPPTPIGGWRASLSDGVLRIER